MSSAGKSPEVPLSGAEMVQALTANITFEDGVTANDLIYLEPLGFLAVRNGGRDVGGVELVGFRASNDGQYDRNGGTCPSWKYIESQMTVGEHLVPPEKLTYAPYTGAKLSFANQSGAVMDFTALPNGAVTELWSVVVPRRIRDIRRGAGYGAEVHVTNRQLDRPPLTWGDLRGWWHTMRKGANGGQATLNNVTLHKTVTPESLPTPPIRLEVALPVQALAASEGEPIPLRVRKLGAVATA